MNTKRMTEINRQWRMRLDNATKKELRELQDESVEGFAESTTIKERLRHAGRYAWAHRTLIRQSLPDYGKECGLTWNSKPIDRNLTRRIESGEKVHVISWMAVMHDNYFFDRLAARTGK